ncbi:extracellular catalytic domain type 2 short-chain-length polyhydroxyalkanoate depolymerase [Vibrio nitrifigilis]|nr:PHB depolymerase family esterase [Vibrio nitrifigilis]
MGIFSSLKTSVITLMTWAWISATAHAAAPALPSVGANINETSVSGLSSGGFMASQLYLSHSSIMAGVGIVAGGPYLCAQSWPMPGLTNAVMACMAPQLKEMGPNTSKLIRVTKGLARDGDIDDLQRLKSAHFYFFSGKNDSTVNTIVVNQAVELYKALGVSEKQINYDKTVNAGHAFIVNNKQANKCNTSKAPFINDCGFSQAERILATIYPNLDKTPQTPLPQAVPFNQSVFIKAKKTGMDDTGYVYIPPQCKTGTSCAVHVVFHGCQQGATVIGDKFYNGTGYNAYANANNIIMLYPQLHVSPRETSVEPYNPKGCWDFWGYSGSDYFDKKAPQISAVYRMIETLAAQP